MALQDMSSPRQRLQFYVDIYLGDIFIVALGGVVVSVPGTGPKVRGFRPGRGRWVCDGLVIKSVARLHDFLRRGSKAVGPMS
jgi:hypothetical protein